MTTVTELKKLFIELGGNPEDLKGCQTDADVIKLLSEVVGSTIELPAVSASDNGKVLKVVEGAWGKGTDESAPKFVKFYENTLETDTNQISIPVESEYSEIIILYGIDPETGEAVTGERFPYASTELIVGLNNNTSKGLAPHDKTDISIIHITNVGDSLYEINIENSTNNTDSYVGIKKAFIQKATELSSIKIGLSSGNMKADASTFIAYGK